MTGFEFSPESNGANRSEGSATDVNCCTTAVLSSALRELQQEKLAMAAWVYRADRMVGMSVLRHTN